MQDHNILNNAQHGFRKKKSTETALLQLTKSLFERKATKIFTYIVALDFSRAFDTLDFKIMCNILSYFISESMVTWFHSYLTSRQQSTKYCGITSDACSLLNGIPQGGVLSATLFTIYLNNLLNLLDQDTAIAYADDITVIGSSQTPSEAYDNIIKIITTTFNWADCHCLLLNFNKCQSMLLSPFTEKQFVTNTELFIPNASKTILTLKELRIFGVILSNNLKWTNQSSHVCKSASKMIDVLNGLGTSLYFTSS